MIESRVTGSFISFTGSSHWSNVWALIFRRSAFTKEAFDSPITLRASSTVAETAACVGTLISKS